MPVIIKLVILNLFYFAASNTICDPCLFNHTYRNSSAATIEPIRYRFQINDTSQVVRVWVQSVNATSMAPLIVVVRETRAVLSWQVPLGMNNNKYTYNTVSRTLCPINETTYHAASIGVELSSSSFEPVHFALNATLNQRHVLTTTPSEPQYVAFIMPDDVDTVLIRVTSSHSNCMYVSVQDIQCPVFDLDTNVQFSGQYQTVSTKGAITVSRSKMSKFYIVFVMKSNDVDCYPERMETIVPSSSLHRSKTIEVWVERTINRNGYIVAIASTIAVLAGIYIVALGLTCLFDMRENRDPEIVQQRKELVSKLCEERALLRSPIDSPLYYGSLDVSVSENLSAAFKASAVSSDPKFKNGNNIEEQGTSSNATDVEPEEPQVEEEEYDSLPDAVLDKRIIRSKPHLYVADLARKSHKHIGKKYNMYFWNICTIAIFYTLPVVQLVLTYQTVVAVTGNEDLCYYNFDCVRPLGAVFAFNSLFSNAGYVMLGILFLILVRKRDIAHQKRMAENEVLECNYGVPRHYGLFYSMGVALAMEGGLSACYHVCPNYTNFQFDTAFMYMIAALGMLKIYQIRHPDINAHAHIAYAVMALVILLAVIGVLYNSLTFWIIFSVCYIILVFMMSAEFYFKSEWKLDRSVFPRIRMEWLSSKRCSFFKPSYPDRMIYILFVNAVNLTFVVLGVLKQPKDFPSFLLMVFISNLILYLMFYIVMKIRHRERLYLRVIFFIILACFTWAAGFLFYSQNKSSWMKTPAESRQLNGDCILFDFYDSHDVWHFLSALSLFLSFMVVLVMDDDLIYKSQDVIHVF